RCAKRDRSRRRWQAVQSAHHVGQLEQAMETRLQCKEEQSPEVLCQFQEKSSTKRPGIRVLSWQRNYRARHVLRLLGTSLAAKRSMASAPSKGVHFGQACQQS